MVLLDESGFRISQREQNLQKPGGKREPLCMGQVVGAGAYEQGYEICAGGTVGPGGQGRDAVRLVLCLAWGC